MIKFQNSSCSLLTHLGTSINLNLALVRKIVVLKMTQILLLQVLQHLGVIIRNMRIIAWIKLVMLFSMLHNLPVITTTRIQDKVTLDIQIQLHQPHLGVLPKAQALMRNITTLTISFMSPHGTTTLKNPTL